MPFFHYSNNNKINKINLNLYHPVEVIVSHAQDGRLKPLYFKYIEKDESRHTIKIEIVHSLKEKDGTFEYYCRGTNLDFHVSRDFILVYFILDHIWALKK